MTDLTPRQNQLLAFIQAHIAEKGCPPTMREMAAHLGVTSTNGVNDHLLALEKKGHVMRGERGTMRSLRLITPAGASMTEAEAERINGILCGIHFHLLGLQRECPDARGLSLGQMIEARDIVRRTKKRDELGRQVITATPDDRLIAAIYAWANYEPSQEAIVIGQGRALVVVAVEAARSAA